MNRSAKLKRSNSPKNLEGSDATTVARRRKEVASRQGGLF